MNVIEIMREFGKMCSIESEHGCSGCGLSCEFNGTGETCEKFMVENPEKTVEIVEKWVAEHPKKTRQSEFLKMFPNAQLDDDGMFNFSLNPCDIDPEYADKVCDQYSDCQDCQREYWSEEVE